MRAALGTMLWLCACSWLSACDNGDFGTSYQACQQDSDCSNGDVCARAGACFPADQIRQIAVVWTVNGQAASDTSCGAHPSFTLQFEADNGFGYGYEPVPCAAGKFTVDKMPTIVNFVEMFDDGQAGGEGMIQDGTDQASLDLQFTQ